MNQNFMQGLKIGMGISAAMGIGLVAASSILLGDFFGNTLEFPGNIARLLRLIIFSIIVLGTGRLLATSFSAFLLIGIITGVSIFSGVLTGLALFLIY
jgi:hypothetical protein